MALEINRVTFDPLRSYTSHRDLAWSRLTLSFKDTETDCYPLIDLTLLQKVSPGTTIGELERAATDRTKAILRAALDLIEANDLTSLIQKEEDKRQT